MIEIATPMSHLFENKEDAFDIIAVSDCLECRERSIALTYPKQHLFHWDIDLGHRWTEDLKSYIKNTLKAKPDLKLISFQVAVNCEDPVLIDRMYQPGGYRYTKKEMLENSVENTAWLRSCLPESTTLCVENNNYYPTEAYDLVASGSFLTELVKKNRIGLLYDIAHGMVSAHNLGISYSDYLHSMPLEDIVQLHICQPDLGGQIAFDVHDAPDEKMFRHVEQFLIEFPVRYLTVEYYRDKERLIQSLLKLNEIIKRFGVDDD